MGFLNADGDSGIQSGDLMPHEEREVMLVIRWPVMTEGSQFHILHEL